MAYRAARPLLDRATPCSGRLSSRRSERLERTAGDAHFGRHASPPSDRAPTTATAGESGANRCPGVERLMIILGMAERTPPPPDPSPTGRPSGHAVCESTRGRRRPDATQSGRSISASRRRRHGRPRPAAGAPSSSARRPDRLAFYMGYCPHCREDHVRRDTLPSSWVIRTPDQGLVLEVPSGRLPKIV